MKFRIRFNRSRGQPGRGTPEHVWRVFDETGKEWLCKHVILSVPSSSEKEQDSEDWNIVCTGQMQIDKQSSTITFVDSTV